MKYELEFDDVRAAKLVKKICYRTGFVLVGLLSLYVIFAIFRFSFLLAGGIALVTAFFLAMLWAEYVLGGHVSPYSADNTRTKGMTIVTFGAMVWFIILFVGGLMALRAFF